MHRLNHAPCFIEGLIGHSSHILLAGQGPIDIKDESSKEEGRPTPEGKFTKELLNVLTSQAFTDLLPTMAYKDLIDILNG